MSTKPYRFELSQEYQGLDPSLQQETVTIWTPDEAVLCRIALTDDRTYDLEDAEELVRHLNDPHPGTGSRGYRVSQVEMGFFMGAPGDKKDLKENVGGVEITDPTGEVIATITDFGQGVNVIDALHRNASPDRH